MEKKAAKTIEFPAQPDEARETIARLRGELARKTEEVEIIQQISSGILSTLDLDSILAQILEATDSLLGFRHSMILLADDGGKTLRVQACRGYADGALGAEIPVGTGPLGMAAKKRRIMRLGNINTQMAYQKAVRKQVEQGEEGENLGSVAHLPGLPGAESQIGIPLVVREQLVGVFAVESERLNAFDELDGMLLTIVGNQLATSIANARLHGGEIERSQELARLNSELTGLTENLESKVAERTAELTTALEKVNQEQERSTNLLMRIAPPELIPALLRDELGARRVNLTILFTDLQGFTSYSSGLEPDEIFSQLNFLFESAGTIIQRYRGYINKTIGDSIMGLFGVPYGNNSHPIDAVLAGISMQLELEQKSPLPMRIGINSGVITAGMLGSANKSLYDVLGDAVNVASRMESLCEPGGVVISQETCALVAPYIEYESMGEHEIKGKGLWAGYRVLGIKNLATDDRRVDPTSRFAREFLSVVDEVYAYRRKHFSMVDFLSLQSRDGAISHNEAVASFSVALLRFYRGGWGKSEGGVAKEISSVKEETLLQLALLHDIGKHSLTGEVLNSNFRDGWNKIKLRDALLASSLEAMKKMDLAHLCPMVEEFYEFEGGGGEGREPSPMVEIIAVADIFDALTAPKLYKGKPWRIRGALEELMRMPFCQSGERPLVRAFAELMKPEGVRVSVRKEEKILFR